VLEFVPAEQIDPILYATAYYAEPDGAAVKPYVLLREALTRTNQIAIVKVALRQREQLATLRVRGNVLVLNTMLWPDEVREPTFTFLDADVEARPAELAMATSLIESMATDFHPKQYTDDYRSALHAIIEAKVAGREVVSVEEDRPAPTTAADLMTALRASVERARAARAEPEKTTKPPRKRATPRKAPAATTSTAGTAKHAPTKAPGRKPSARKPKSGSPA
jgi:DNA end-binding protein Ku